MTKGGGGDEVAQRRRRRSRRGGDDANAPLRIRLLAIGLALAVLWAPLVAEGQQAEKAHRIGILFNSTREQNISNIRALEEGLQERGYVEGRNLTIERRFADSRPERLPVLAAELANLNLDVIVVNINRTAVAVQQVTTKIPIVMALAEDPVDVGLVKSLAHPGGNITGVTVMAGREIYSKNLELLKEVLPKGARIAVLYDTTSPIHPLFLKVLDEAARKLKVRLVPTGIRSAEDFEKAFTLMKQERASGFLVLGGGPPSSHRQRINDLAVRRGLACMWPTREGVDTGGLMGYGVYVADLFRRAAPYVDKILKGAMPADLPMEQPTKFWFSINLKTAKTLGLTMPPSLLLRADEVIQ
jgi:putative ABC transport system substrate-binding protein